MKCEMAAALTLAASASAFITPSLPVRSHVTASSATSVTMNGERSKALPMLPRPPALDGSMAGDVGFDPLGLSSITGLAGADLYWMREAELKHCRLSMLAVVGILWCDQIGSLPGMPSGTNQMKLFWQVWAEKPQIIWAGFIFVGIIEMISGIAITAAQENGDREPGDFGLDPLDLANKPQEKARYQLNEVKNGRLAMWAAAGMILQGVTTDQSALGNLIG